MDQAVKKQPRDRYQAAEYAYRSKSKKLGQEYFVVDCDRHIIEPPEAFTTFLDEEWQRMAPRPTTDNTGAPRLMVEGRLYQARRNLRRLLGEGFPVTQIVRMLLCL